MPELIALVVLGVLMAVAFATLIVPSGLYLLRDSIQSRDAGVSRR